MKLGLTFLLALCALDLQGAPPAPTSGFMMWLNQASQTSAAFSFSPTSGEWPLTVQFTDLTQGGPSAWAWDFGDGGTTNSRNPLHVFNSPSNTFTVQLIASGPGGSSTASHTLATTNPTTFRLLSNVANTFSYRIVRSPNGFRAVVIQPPFPHVAQLFAYDTIGHTNYVDLTNTDNNSVGSESTLCFLGNRMLLLHNLSVTVPNVQEYDLLTNGFGMPTQTVYITTSPSIGITGTANGAIVNLSNGGAAVFTHGSGENFHVVYRTPSGTWTNMPDINNSSIEGWNNLLPTALQAAEHPDGHSVWLTVQGDFSGWIWGAKFQATATALNLQQTNIIVDIVTTNGNMRFGEMAPYAERVWPHVVSDWTNGHRLLLGYGNFTVNTDPNYADFSTIRAVGTSLSNDFSVFPAWHETNRIKTYDSPTITLPQSTPGTMCMTFPPWDTNSYVQGVFPLSQQDDPGGPTNYIENITEFNPWLVDDYSRDVVYRQAGGTWYLKIKP